MIDVNTHKAIHCLDQKGKSERQIAKILAIGRNTVRKVLKEGDEKLPETRFKDKITLDEDFVRELHQDCSGWVKRMHEIINTNYDIKIAYSTLTRKVRDLGLSVRKHKNNKRYFHVQEIPGEEQQHDTTTYNVLLGERKVKLVASLLYFRYSKVRYLKFYESFCRFHMKLFLHEAIMFFGYSAKQTIIDNTNLARHLGSGRDAIIASEMEQFGLKYGYTFVCHAINNPNRKAGCERALYTTETSFLPGRKFTDLDDLNRQALIWSTETFARRPHSKTGLIPIEVFEKEKSFLKKVCKELPPPYRTLQRGLDQYGCFPFNGNDYWVPGKGREEVTIIEYERKIKVYRHHEHLVEYSLPLSTVKAKRFYPEGQKPPQYKPKAQKTSGEDEKQLRKLSSEVNEYLDFIKGEKGFQKHKFIRKLHAFSKKLAPSLLSKTLKRATKFKIIDFPTLEKMAYLLMREGEVKTPSVEMNHTFVNSSNYQEGRISESPDLSEYSQYTQNDNKEDEEKKSKEEDINNDG